MKNKSEFFGFMSAHDVDDASEGAWFAMLEQAGEEWLIKFPEKGRDGNDMAHRYLKMVSGGK